MQITRYDWADQMTLGHPIDAQLRAHLRVAKRNQKELAHAIGRSQGWLSKYIQGDGHATIDDVVRLLAVLIGVEIQPLSDVERRVVKALRVLPDDRLDDAVSSIEAVAKRYRQLRHPESDARTGHRERATNRRARDIREGDGASTTTEDTSTPPMGRRQTVRQR